MTMPAPSGRQELIALDQATKREIRGERSNRTMPKSDQQPLNSTELALVRTELAQERTLMAWIRTAFSMISFGFTIFKFFQYLGEAKTLEIHRPATSARNLGGTLILLGTTALIMATFQHWRWRKRMQSQGYALGFSLSLVVAVLIIALGLLAFISSFMRTGVF
jgi:putative membrane protein